MYKFIVDYSSLIGILVTVLVALPGFYLMYQAITKKKLSYIVVSNSKLNVITSQLARGSIEYIHNGLPLVNPVLVTLRFIHSGNHPIKEDDFRKEIEIKFDRKIRPKSAIIEYPNTAYTVATHIVEESSSVTIDKFLLNQRDSFELRIIGDATDENSFTENNITIDGKIVGVKKIRKLTNRSKKLTHALGILFSLFNILAVFLIFLAAAFFSKVINANHAVWVIPSLLLIVIFSGIISSMFLFNILTSNRKKQQYIS